MKNVMYGIFACLLFPVGSASAGTCSVKPKHQNSSPCSCTSDYGCKTNGQKAECKGSSGDVVEICEAVSNWSCECYLVKDEDEEGRVEDDEDRGGDEDGY